MPYSDQEVREFEATAAELARWQGRTDAHMNENSRRLDAMNGDVRAVREDITLMRAELASIKTKVGFYSAIGGLLGAGIVSFILAIATGVVH